MLPRNRNNSSKSINEAENVATNSSSDRVKGYWRECFVRNSRDLETRNKSCQPKNQLRSQSLPPFVGAYYIGTLNAVDPRHPYFSRNSRSSSRNKENQPVRSTSQPPNRTKTKMNSDSKKLVNDHVPSATAERIEMRYRQRLNNARQLLNDSPKKENKNTLSFSSSKNGRNKGVPWSQSKPTSKTPPSPSPTQNSYSYPKVKRMDTFDYPTSSSPSRLPIKRQHAISNFPTPKDKPQSKSAKEENTPRDLRNLSKIPTPNKSTKQPSKTRFESLHKADIECRKSRVPVVINGSKTDRKTVVDFQLDSSSIQQPSDVSMSTEPFTDDEHRDEDMNPTEDSSLASLVTDEMQSDYCLSTPTQNNSPISFNSQSETSSRPDGLDVSMYPEMFSGNESSLTEEESRTLPMKNSFDSENSSPISTSEFPKLDPSDLSPSSSKFSSSSFITHSDDIRKEEYLNSSNISETTTIKEDLESLQDIPAEYKMDLLEESKKIEREEDFETLAPRLVADPIEIEDFKLIHKTIVPQSPNSTEVESENVEVPFLNDTKESLTNENRQVEYIIAESEIKEFFQDCVTSEKFPGEIETESSIQPEETENSFGVEEENESKRQIVLQETVSDAQSPDNESNSIKVDSLELNCMITDNMESSEARIKDLEYKDTSEKENEKQNIGLIEEPFNPIITTEDSSEPTITTVCSPEPIITTEYSSEPIVTTEYSSEPTITTVCSPEPIITTECSPEPIITTEYSSEPIVTTEYFSEPTITTVCSPEPIITTECSSEPTITIVCSPEPIITAEYSSEPIITTEYSSEPTITTVCSPEPIITTEYSSEPIITTEYSSEPIITTEYSSEPTITTVCSAEPIITTEYSSEPIVTNEYSSVTEDFKERTTMECSSMEQIEVLDAVVSVEKDSLDTSLEEAQLLEQTNECSPEPLVTTEYTPESIVINEYSPKTEDSKERSIMECTSMEQVEAEESVIIEKDSLETSLEEAESLEQTDKCSTQSIVTTEYSSEPIITTEYSSETVDSKERTIMECASMEQVEVKKATVILEKDSLDTSLEEAQSLEQTDDTIMINAEKPIEQISVAASMKESFETRSEEKSQMTYTDIDHFNDTSFKSSFSNESQEDIDIAVAFVNQKQGFKRFAKIRKKLQAIFSSSSVDKTKYTATDLLAESTNDLVIHENIEEMSAPEIFPDELSLARLISKDPLENYSEEKDINNAYLREQDDLIKAQVTESTNNEKEDEIKSTEYLSQTDDSSFAPTFNESDIGSQGAENIVIVDNKDETNKVFVGVTENKISTENLQETDDSSFATTFSESNIDTKEGENTDTVDNKDEISEVALCVTENKISTENLPETAEISFAPTLIESDIGSEETKNTEIADNKEKTSEVSVCVTENKITTENLPETVDSWFRPTFSESNIDTGDADNTDTVDNKDEINEVFVCVTENKISTENLLETVDSSLAPTFSESNINTEEAGNTDTVDNKDETNEIFVGVTENKISTENLPETDDNSFAPTFNESDIGPQVAKNTDTADNKDKTSEVSVCLTENKISAENLPETGDSSFAPTFSESNINTEEVENTDTVDNNDETNGVSVCLTENNQTLSREVIMTVADNELTPVLTEEYLEVLKEEEECSEAPQIEEVIENPATTPEITKNKEEGPVSRFFNRLFSKRKPETHIDLNRSNNQEAEAEVSSQLENGHVAEKCTSAEPTDNVEAVCSVQKEDTLEADPKFSNLLETIQVYEGCEIDADGDDMKRRTTKNDCLYSDSDREENKLDVVSETEIEDQVCTENVQLPNTESEEIMVVSNSESKMKESSELSTCNNGGEISTGHVSIDDQNNLQDLDDVTGEEAKESDNIPVESKTTDSATKGESKEELNELQCADQFNPNMSDSEIKEFFQDCVTSEKLVEKAEMENGLPENQLNYTEKSETIISRTEEINDENPGIQTLSKDSEIKESAIEENIPEKNQPDYTETSEIIISRTEKIKDEDPGIETLSKDGDPSADQGIRIETEILPEEKIEMEGNLSENQLNYTESPEIIISRTEETKEEDPEIQTLSKDGDSPVDQEIKTEAELLPGDDDVKSSEGNLPEVRSSEEEESKTDVKTEVNETETKKPAIVKKPFFGFVPKLKRAFNFKSDKKDQSSNSPESENNADPEVKLTESTQEPLTTIEEVGHSPEMTILEEEVLQPSLATSDVVEETLLEVPLEVTSTETVLLESENLESDTLELVKIETDEIVTDNQVDSPTIATICETEAPEEEQNAEEIADCEEKEQEQDEDIFYFEPELPADNLKSEEFSNPTITNEEHSEKSDAPEEIGAGKSRSWYEKVKDFFGSKKAKEGSFDEVLQGDSTFRRSESYHTKQLDSDVAPGSCGSTHWSDIVDENVVATLTSDMLDEESSPKEYRSSENDPSPAEPNNFFIDPDADNVPTDKQNEDDSNSGAQNAIAEVSVPDINDSEDQSAQTIFSPDNPDSKITSEKPYPIGVTPEIDLAVEVVPSIESTEDVKFSCSLPIEAESENGDRPVEKILEVVVEEELETSVPSDIKKLDSCPPDEVNLDLDTLNEDQITETELEIDQIDPESDHTEILPIQIEEPENLAENQTIPEYIPVEETAPVMEEIIQDMDCESYENALLLVFAYLDHKTLCVTSQVCKQWRSISYCPSLWQHVVFSHGRMTSKFLEIFSDRCSQLKTLILENIQGRPKRRGESERFYQEEIRASLEPGLESILIKAEGNLQKLSFINCGPVITERCLWLVSCYARVLQDLTYRSTTDPPSAEVLWALASGCRDITHLNLSPDNPRSPQQERFNNKCAHLIAKNYPRLKSISVGGSGIDDVGLLIIAEKCQQLERLELYNFVHKIVESSVEAMCRNGLQNLQELYFIHTAVDAKIIPVFARNCPNLMKIKIQVDIQDYFGDIVQPKDRRKYKVIGLKLKSLKSQSKLDQILELDIKDCK